MGRGVLFHFISSLKASHTPTLRPMASAVSAFSLLPESDRGPWAPDIQVGYAIVEWIYNEATQGLRSDEFPESTRIAFHINALSSTALPILKAFVPDRVVSTPS